MLKIPFYFVKLITMNDKQIKNILYRNYSRFCNMISRKDFVVAVSNYIKSVNDSVNADCTNSRDYASIDSLCKDFYYCEL